MSKKEKKEIKPSFSEKQKKNKENRKKRSFSEKPRLAKEADAETLVSASDGARVESAEKVEYRLVSSPHSSTAYSFDAGDTKTLSFGFSPGFPVQERGAKKLWLTFLAMSFVMVWVISNAWSSDDAFITFRTIDNWFRGYGLRWNPLERVQSYTHPLWMFLVAGLYAVFGDFYVSVMLLSLVLDGVMLGLLFYYGARSTWHILLGALVLGCSRAYVDFATSGLENPLAHLLLVVFLLLFFRWVQDERTQVSLSGIEKESTLTEKKTREKKSKKLWFVSYGRVGVLVFLACLGVLNRTDHALLFGFPLLYVLWHTRWRFRLLGVLFLASLPLLAWELFSLVYYGSLVPNTAYAKLSASIPAVEMWMQGLFYYRYALVYDPLTLVCLVGGGVLMLARLVSAKQRALGFVGLGVLAYAVYVVRIGGDFMAGRFLSALVVIVVVVMVRERLRLVSHLLPAMGFVVLLHVYGANPVHQTGKSFAGWEQTSGVGDERAYYFRTTGLVYASVNKRMPSHDWWRDGERDRAQGLRVIEKGALGMYGVAAGPGVHIVDRFALCDPLLARLPMRRLPNEPWRVGHYYRLIPQGYHQAAIGNTTLKDPDLRRYYEKIQLVTRGPLFSKERWEAIWGLHTGRYRRWLERYRERAYHLYTEREMGWMRRKGDDIRGLAFLWLSMDGIGVQLQQPSAKLYEGSFSVGVSRGLTYRIAFLRDGKIVGEERFFAPGVFGEGLYVYQGRVPKKLLGMGLEAIKIFPTKPSKRAYVSHLVAWRHPLKTTLQKVSIHRGAGTAWNAKGNMILGGWGGYKALEIQLPKRSNSPRLHVSFDSNDDLTVSFLLGGEEVGRTTLFGEHRVGGGLQVAYVYVPASARKKGFDRVVLRPLAGDGVYSIGHLYVLKD